MKITYKAGTGDSPDDFYVAYIDPASGKLKLASYVVTLCRAPKRETGRGESEPHAIVFDEWQEVDGLAVPKVAQYYVWKDENIVGEPLGKMSFLNVHFSQQPPGRSAVRKTCGCGGRATLIVIATGARRSVVAASTGRIRNSR